jgi:hypothetical protein
MESSEDYGCCGRLFVILQLTAKQAGLFWSVIFYCYFLLASHTSHRYFDLETEGNKKNLLPVSKYNNTGSRYDTKNDVLMIIL